MSRSKAVRCLKITEPLTLREEPSGRNRFSGAR
jgi:hypothetical protein